MRNSVAEPAGEEGIDDGTKREGGLAQAVELLVYLGIKAGHIRPTVCQHGRDAHGIHDADERDEVD